MTNFPKKGEDKKVSLSNSNVDRFPRAWAARIKEEHPKIWRAGGNIRGNSAWSLYNRALDGDDAPAVVSWIKEREAWAARHAGDGSQFPEKSATLSSIAGVVAAMKWGVVLNIGEKTMKDAVNEVIDKQKESERTEAQETETRDIYASGSTCEIRKEGDSEKIVGYAALYNSPTQIGSFREVIKPGAFDDVVDGDVRMLINHDPNQVVARTTSGTLKLELDERGLKYTAEPGSQTYARDLVESIRRGDISGSSFAFSVKPDGQEWNEDRTERSIFRVDSLAEVSAVVFPAYDESSVTLRSEEPEEAPAPDPIPEQKTPTNKPERMSLETNEIRRKMSELNERTEALNNQIEADGRQAYAEERSELDSISEEYGRLSEKLQRAEQIERQRAALVTPSHTASSSADREVNKLNRRFSLSKALVGAAYGSLDGVEREFFEEAQKEARDSGMHLEGNFALPNFALRAVDPGFFASTDDTTGNAGASGTTTGSAFIPEQVGPAIEQLRPNPILQQMGVPVLNGLTGNIALPKATGFDAVAETEASALAAIGEISQVNLTPKRVGGEGRYTKQLLVQGGAGVDALIAREMGRAITEKIDALSIEGDGSTAGHPSGLKTSNTAATATTASTDTIEDSIAAMEAQYISAGGDMSRAVYLFGPQAHAAARKTAMISNVSSVYDAADQMRVMGRPVYVSKHVTDSAAAPELYLLDPQALVLAYFGAAVDFIVDPYSSGSTSQIRLYAHRYFDFAVRQDSVVIYESDAKP